MLSIHLMFVDSYVHSAPSTIVGPYNVSGFLCLQLLSFQLGTVCFSNNQLGMPTLNFANPPYSQNFWQNILRSLLLCAK